MYGPTETTIWSTTARVEQRSNSISIGRPIGNTEVYLVDDWLQPVPVNIPGQLYISGEGVVRGYLNWPELTADRFLPNPFTKTAGGRLYKTGDVARYSPDGSIEFLGRIDNQVKLRGFRIELSEIETALAQHSAVQQTAVLLRENPHGEKRLVAYVVTEPGVAFSVGEMREFLKRKLPDYMMPSTLVTLENMPLTPNGKIHRNALPAPEQVKPELEKPYEAPRNATEEILAGIWADLLDLEQVGIHDEFFEIGGHSILASQLISSLRETFQVELPLRSFFQAPTIAGLTATLFEVPERRKRVEKIAELLRSIAPYSEQEVEVLLGKDS
jgi:hypothetical protein